MHNKIYILADGGLGNRMAGLIAGFITADRLGMQPVICWPSNNWCGCRFNDLFDDRQHDVNCLGIRDLFHEWADRVFLTHENQIQAELRHTAAHGRHGEQLARDLRKDVVFYTARVPEHLPADLIPKTLCRLQPHKRVQAIVNNFLEQHSIDSGTVGLHLRKTDQYNLDEDWWYDYVQRKGAGRRYFVCSDDRDTESRFAELKNVVTFPKTHYVEKLVAGPWRQDAVQDPDGRLFPNNINRTRQSVIQAWIDLLILSETYILPTVKSSFSQVAHWLKQSRSA